MVLVHEGTRLTFVALLAEGVDRNTKYVKSKVQGGVALLAEGVDRNNREIGCMIGGYMSPSSRRAWIEMLVLIRRSVSSASRPSRGGRG